MRVFLHTTATTHRLSLFLFPNKRGNMSIEYDEKGKIFTDIVSKIAVYAMIQTTTHRMRGRLHIRRDQRVKDELDRKEGFLAFTEVTVFDDDNKVLFEAPFVAVQREHIVWVLPETDHNEDQDS